MTRPVIGLAVLALIAAPLLSACGVDPAEEAGVSEADSALAPEGAGAPEIISHRMNPHVDGQVTIGGSGAVSPLINHGGPVIGTPTAYIIWYGNWNQTNGSDTPAGQQIVRDFLANIGGSPYYQLNSTLTSQITGGANFGGETVDTGTSTRLKDADILKIVNNAVSSKRLPFDANGVYFVLTSSNVTETTGFCTKYCGWHTAANASSGHLRYSFVGNANRCLSSCAAQTVSPNGNAGVDGMISVIAHELEEATTDPDLNAWYDSSGAENADKCAWTFGANTTLPSGAAYNMTLGSRNYLIQRNVKRTSSGDFCALN